MWIIVGKALKEIDREDDRLDWGWRSSPAKTVKFTLRRGSSHFVYASYGETPQDAADAENRYRLREIAHLEDQIAARRAELFKVPDETK